MGVLLSTPQPQTPLVLRAQGTSKRSTKSESGPWKHLRQVGLAVMALAGPA